MTVIEAEEQSSPDMKADSAIRPGRLIGITGAAGFVGRAIVRELSAHGYKVRALSRGGEHIPGATENVAVGDLSGAQDPTIFENCQAVVQCAARVHVFKRESPERSAKLYRTLNAELPVTLAERARQVGVRRFVQVSSVAAIRSTSPAGSDISDESRPDPHSEYGKSKLSADIALAELSSAAFTTISLRPPTLYGPGVGAFFKALDRAARLGLPLPLASIDNRRSFMFVNNFASAITAALGRDDEGCFVVTDAEPISTAELYRRLLGLHGYGDRVSPLPPTLVAALAKLALRGRVASLLGDAAYDGTRFKRVFGWEPPASMDEALAATVGNTP